MSMNDAAYALHEAFRNYVELYASRAEKIDYVVEQHLEGINDACGEHGLILFMAAALNAIAADHNAGHF